jgi:hypothetical protein
MDDLFDFSFSGFGGFSDLFSGDSIFSSDGEGSGDGFSTIAQQVAKFALTQALAGGSNVAQSGQHLATSFARQAFNSAAPSDQPDSYFGVSSGQTMAMLASMISRAGRRFL